MGPPPYTSKYAGRLQCFPIIAFVCWLRLWAFFIVHYLLFVLIFSLGILSTLAFWSSQLLSFLLSFRYPNKALNVSARNKSNWLWIKLMFWSPSLKWKVMIRSWRNLWVTSWAKKICRVEWWYQIPPVCLTSCLWLDAVSEPHAWTNIGKNGCLSRLLIINDWSARENYVGSCSCFGS